MHFALLAAVSGLAIVQAGAASAQDVDPAETESGEVVVIGDRAGRSLQDTTASVAVTAPGRIEQENLLLIQDVYQRTINVTETSGSSGFTIRGIANRIVSDAGDGATSTIYVDGAAMPSSLNQAAPTDLWDVAQVEILRGR